MLAADVGVTATETVIEDLKDRAFQEKIKKPEDAKELLKEILVENIDYEAEEYSYPLVILLSGVNGVGKTTAIGKLAHMFREQGKSVVVAAADTFRAAASEQLEVWGKRAGVRVIRHSEGADPAAVVFDAVSSAKAKNTDVILVDTAGRLHNKKNLMEELKKSAVWLTANFLMPISESISYSTQLRVRTPCNKLKSFPKQSIRTA